MPSVLHPCPGCGHESMDACWAASNTLLKRHRRLCVECHDECLAKPTARGKARPTRPPTPNGPDPRLFFVPA